MIERHRLEQLYYQEKLSMSAMAALLGCSVHTIVYWMDSYQLKRRTISEAIYHKHNPGGDPFVIRPIETIEQAKLFGMGLGLYWGEGNKANQYAIRLGNTDPELLKTFIRFLMELFGVDKNDLRFGLQIFSDINPSEALLFWTSELSVQATQFYKPTITISGSIGTYQRKSRYGVVTVHFHNKKLRDILVEMLPR